MATGPLITRLDRYMFRQLAVALVAVTGGLTALIWLTQSLRFVELVINHGLSLGVFFELTGLLIPSFVAVILPITCFVVVQFVYQRLSGDRELTVMRSAGLSQLALSRPAIAVALLAMIAGYLLNMWLVPESLTRFREFQWEIRNRMAAFLLQEGVFNQVSDDMTVYVRSRDTDGTLRGVLVDDERDKNQPATVLAERGRLVDGPSGPRVILFNGSRQQIDRQNGRLDILTFGQNAIDLSQTNQKEGERLRDMSEVPLGDLLDPHPENAQDIPKWIAEGHKRLAGPLTGVSFALVALFSVLSGTFHRHGNFIRPMAAVAAVVVLLATGLAFGNLAARDNALLPLIWIHATAPGLFCAWLLYGPRLARRSQPSTTAIAAE